MNRRRQVQGFMGQRRVSHPRRFTIVLQFKAVQIELRDMQTVCVFPDSADGGFGRKRMSSFVSNAWTKAGANVGVGASRSLRLHLQRVHLSRNFVVLVLPTQQHLHFSVLHAR